MLGRRRRTLGKCLVFAGTVLYICSIQVYIIMQFEAENKPQQTLARTIQNTQATTAHKARPEIRQKFGAWNWPAKNIRL